MTWLTDLATKHGMGARSVQTLRALGVGSFADVARLSRRDVLGVTGCGRKTLKEIERVLGELPAEGEPPTPDQMRRRLAIRLGAGRGCEQLLKALDVRTGTELSRCSVDDVIRAGYTDELARQLSAMMRRAGLRGLAVDHVGELVLTRRDRDFWKNKYEVYSAQVKSDRQREAREMADLHAQVRLWKKKYDALRAKVAAEKRELKL